MTMEFITENGKEYILVSKQAHVEEIVNRMVKQEPFAEQFKFSERDLFIALLESVMQYGNCIYQKVSLDMCGLALWG